MGKVINMHGKQVDSISLHEARQYFPGRKGNLFMGYRSLKQKIYRGDIPGDAVIKINGMHWIDRNYLTGASQTNNAA